MKSSLFLTIAIAISVATWSAFKTPESKTRNTSQSEVKTPDNLRTSPASNSNGSKTESASIVSPEISENIASGSFVAIDHPTIGEAKIITQGDGQYLELSEDFQTDAGPDLVVVLHRSRELQKSALNEGDYIALAPLKEVRGLQRYEIPEGVDLQNHGSVAIWCRQFNVTFGYATLQ